MEKTRQNLFWAFLYNTIMISVATEVLLNPMFGARATAISSLFVLSNSATPRMLKLQN